MSSVLPVTRSAVWAGLGRERWIALTSLCLVAALAWLYLWREADAMTSMAGMGANMAAGMSKPAMSTMAAGDIWNPARLGLTFLMWSVMMAGMMVPSALPTILLYGAMVRKNAERGVALPALWIFAAAYLAVWTGFSLVATVLQAALEQTALLTPGMASASLWLSGGILVAAGIYQWLPLKDICLQKCRSPLQFMMTRWRAGTGGAFRMGAEHGLFCIGCCWVLMLLLFVAGVMNLAWVAAITALVFAEKVLPWGRLWARAAGIGFVAWGVYLPLAS